jgi:hypothetical protein
MSSKKPTPATKPAAAAKPATVKPAAAKPTGVKTAVAKPAAAKTPANKAAETSAKPAAATATVKNEVIEIKSIKIKELAEIHEDRSGLQKASNKWPLIIDTEGTVRTFFRHTDVNFINSSDVNAMSEESLRRSLIGAIRYNRPLAIDLEDRELQLWNETKKYFDSVQNGLLDDLMSKKLLENENFLKLVKIDIDGEEYKDFYFTDIAKFKLIIVVTNENLDKDFLKHFTVYKIVS